MLLSLTGNEHGDLVSRDKEYISLFKNSIDVCLLSHSRLLSFLIASNFPTLQSFDLIISQVFLRIFADDRLRRFDSLIFLHSFFAANAEAEVVDATLTYAHLGVARPADDQEVDGEHDQRYADRETENDEQRGQ